jgi:low affinity Fe/Cu permease
MHQKPSWFGQFTQYVSHITGRPISFIVAFTAIVVWGLTGQFFGFSDTWQLVINTATTIITFLMVFVIQNTQNRDTIAMQIKLDELIFVTQKARNELLNLEELDDKELEALREDYERLAQEIPRHLERRRSQQR